MNRDDYTIAWSEEDNAYLARSVNMPGIIAHGDTQVEALRECQAAVFAARTFIQEKGEKQIIGRAKPGETHPATIVYRNHRKEVAERVVVPKSIEFGIWPEHGPDPCWMLAAHCRTKNAPRHFKLEDIIDWRDAPKDSYDHLLRQWKHGFTNRVSFIVEAMALAGLEDVEFMITHAPADLVLMLREAFKDFEEEDHKASHYYSSAGTEHRFPGRAVAAILAWQGAQRDAP